LGIKRARKGGSNEARRAQIIGVAGGDGNECRLHPALGSSRTILSEFLLMPATIDTAYENQMPEEEYAQCVD
jgi:hypothetical protein